MPKEDKIPLQNSSKRLPIVFCLDISPSMGYKEGTNSSSIDLLNDAVNNFISELKKDTKARAAAEVAFITFSSDIEMNTDFISIGVLKQQVFKTVKNGGTYISKAVLSAVEKIEQRRIELIRSDIGIFAPFLVLVTDGDPDETDNPEMYEKAMSAVKRHCDSHIGASEVIIPFIIGVGDNVAFNTLNRYAEGFTKGYFPIKGEADAVKAQFGNVFKLIGNSTTKSIHLNKTAQEIISTVKNDANVVLSQLLAQIAGK